MILQVRHLMSPDVETLFVDETMDLANTILTLARIRRLPVIDRDGKLVGILSQRDLLRAFAVLYRTGHSDADQVHVSIAEIMTDDVTSIAPDAPALEAAEIIWENKIGCLPVVNDQRVVGIITESDFVRSAITQLSNPNL